MRPRWLCQRQRHAELDEEIRSHLALAEADRIARGESPNEAAHAAQREFGNVSLVKEITREMWGGWWLERLIQDVQYAMRAGFRSLKRTPGFTTTVFLTLAVGIGASTAVFSVVNHVLIQPLPYAEAERLTRIYQFDLDDDEKFVTAVAYKAYRQQLSAFDDVAALYTYRETGRDLVDAAGSQRIRVLPVSHEYFRVLRAQPVLGRGIAPEEETPDARVVVLSERIWRMRYASAPTAIGQTLNLSGETFMVIGVAPSELEDPVAGAIDAWVPLDLRPGDGRDHPDNHSLTVIGRLADGAGFALARAQIQGLDAQLAERYPEAADNQTRMVGLHEDVVGNANRMLLVLLGATGLVLLIVCVNIANLMLVRATAREREFAIRVALGSGRGPILYQLLCETLLLAIAGCLIGTLLAFGLLNAIILIGSSSVPRLADTRFDFTVLAFALLTSLGSALLFGLVPALRFARAMTGDAMRDTPRSVTTSRAQNRSRAALVVVQVAFAFVLLAAASILVLSFHRLRTVDLGIDSTAALTFEVHLPSIRYDAPRRAQFQNELGRRIDVLPGVTSTGATSRLPATGEYHRWGISALTGPLAGDPERRNADAQHRVITGDYLNAIGIQVLQGRAFNPNDHVSAQARALISRSLAERVFPNSNVIGQRIRVPDGEREIIGVVSDVAVDVQGRIEPVVYHAHDQFADNRNWALTHVVRTTRNPESLIPEIRRELQALDPQLVLFRPAPLADLLAQGISQGRFTTWLMGAFAAVALALSSLGLFGVVSFGVRQRRREVGIRMALGARPAAIRRMVVGGALRIVLLGVCVGVLGSIVSARLLNTLVFETRTIDPALLAIAATAMTLAAILASYLPVREATSVDPASVLRD